VSWTDDWVEVDGDGELTLLWASHLHPHRHLMDSIWETLQVSVLWRHLEQHQEGVLVEVADKEGDVQESQTSNDWTIQRQRNHRHQTRSFHQLMHP
jgi:hypothetical protein